MTYDEIKSRLAQVETALQALQNTKSPALDSSYASTTVEQLTTIKQSLQEQLAEAEETMFVSTKGGDTKAVKMDRKTAMDLKKDPAITGIDSAKGAKIKEQEGISFSIEETKAIAKAVGKGLLKALKQAGDEVARIKAHRIEENSFDIHVTYKGESGEDEFSFYIDEDALHLVDFSFDKELVNVGVKPSGEAIVHVDHLANELLKHFKSLSENVNEVNYTDQTDKKSSVLRNNKVSSLIDHKLWRWAIDNSVKLYKGIGQNYMFTDGIMSLGVNLNKPATIVKKWGKVDNELKQIHLKNINEVNRSNYTTPKHFDICPGAEALRDELIKGGKSPEDLGEWTFLHDELFKLEKAVIKANKADERHIKVAKQFKSQIINLSRDLGIEANKIGYLSGHVKKIEDIASKTDGKGDNVTLRSRDIYEGEGDDHHYIKVPSADYKKTMSILDNNIDPTYVKTEVVDNDGAGNVIIYFIFRHEYGFDDMYDDPEGIENPEFYQEPDEDPNAFMYDVVMDLRANDITVTDSSADMDEATDINDPVLMRMRVAKKRNADLKKVDQMHARDRKDQRINGKKRLLIKQLKDKRAEIEREMENDPEIEPTGGPVADRYGDMLNKIDNAIEKAAGRIKPLDYDTAVGKVNENEPTVFDDESFDALRDIILKYVEDPDDAERAVQQVDDQGLDSLAPELIANLERDPEFEAWYDKLHNGPSVDTDYMQRRKAEKDYQQESALGFSDVEKLGSKAASDIDISVRRDPNYTFGKRPGDDDRLRYKYAKQLGYLKENEVEDQGADLDVGHQDDEPSMLKSSAFETATYAAKLAKKLAQYDQVDGEVDFPNWWQKKLILARDYMSAAYHYLDSEEKQPLIDKLALEERQLPVDESAAKIQKAHGQLVAKMKELAKQYKAGDTSVVVQLKDLTAKKKELEKHLDAAVAGIGKGQQLAEVTEDEVQDAIMDLRNLIDEIDGKAEEAREIVRQVFPNELSRLDAYGAFNAMNSANRYDVTLGGFVDRLEEEGFEIEDGEVFTNESKEKEGQMAASKGKKYSENPYEKGTKDHLAWSKGHNSSRARKLSLKEWGSSDQNAMNQSMHRDLGNPDKFPGLSQVLAAAEEAVDFYWDDWEEYKTDREGLVTYAAQRYTSKMFPEFWSNMQKLFTPVDEGIYKSDAQRKAIYATKAEKGKLKEMDGGSLFDYFAKQGYDITERRPDGYPPKEGVVGYQVSRGEGRAPQSVIFQYNTNNNEFTISRMSGYRIDQKDAIKAGMKQAGRSGVAGIDSYMTDGNYNPVGISAEGLKDIVDHVMSGLDREGKAQRDFYKDRGPTSGTIDEESSEWPKKLTSRYSDEYEFRLVKVMSDRAKYEVVDLESGEVKGTQVYTSPDKLKAAAADLIKPQGGTQSTHLGETKNEATRKDLGMSSSISKSRAKAHLKSPSNDGSKVYGLDKDGKRVHIKSINDVDKFRKFELDADINEAVSENIDIKKASTDKLEKILKQSEDEKVSPAFASQLKLIRKELQNRKKNLDADIKEGKDHWADYTDIGMFYMEKHGNIYKGKQQKLSDAQYEDLGKKIVDQLYDGDVAKAYDDIVGPKMDAAAKRLADRGVLKNPRNTDGTPIEEGATCCGKCGRVHVKGTKCKTPYLKGKDHCRYN